MEELKEIFKTREEWLMAAKDLLQSRIFRIWEIPENTKVSCGPCKGKAVGTCYNKLLSESGCTEIFISPKINDELRVLDVLAHELIHSILGVNKKHDSKFKKIAKEIGLLEPWTATTASEELKEELKIFLPTLGKYPHAKLLTLEDKKEQKEPKEQAAKMYVCTGTKEEPHDEWKCLVKKKFIDMAEPICPICGSAMIWDESANKKLKKKVEEILFYKKEK